ncbi:MAG: DUF4382 domain-containing protein [Bacteroidota bacterium]|nr:DUF4382 domain-containing protein [Bacteroidota bacterium]
MKLRESILVISLTLAFIGCSKTNTTAPQSGTGTLQVSMIDSPASYDQVNIVIDSVQAHISTSDSTSGWTTINKTPATYDLLKLVNGANAVIGNATLPVGKYSQIRLYIGSGSNVVVNGVTKSLTTPSGSQSGVKLNVDATIQPDVTYILTIDFDANRSIVTTGNPSNPTYILKPVIRAVATATTGTIIGVVLPAFTRASVRANGQVDTVTTSTDTTGRFKLAYLNPETYNVSIASNDTSYDDTTISNVSVTAGVTTNLDTIMLAHK